MSIFQAICAAVMISAAAFTYEAEMYHDLIPIDAVLVLDVSRSMMTADPYRISRDAMNLFVGNLADERDRVGVVSYAGRVEASREMSVIYSAEDRAALHDFINTLDYASWTDHGLGLLEAIRIMYETHDETRQPIIIFFTDGNLNVNPYGTRTHEQAEYDISLAISRAQEYGFPIYTIGLNFDGALDRAMIDEVADATGGISFETADAEDLPGIMSAIFSVMLPMPQAIEEHNDNVYVPVEIIETPTDPYPAESEPAYITYTPLYEYAETNRTWIFITAIITLTLCLILSKLRAGKRVFTGYAVIIVDGSTNSPIQRSLIEYGKRTTLSNLLGGETSAVFNKVIITPSPTAPSHLPQLILRCKDTRVKFVKDFAEQNSGITLSPGAEVSVRADDMQITIKYAA